MSARAEFVKARTLQRLHFEAPEGRPTSTPTVAVFGPGGNTLSAASADNVTQDTVNTAVSAAGAAVGATLVPLDSLTGLQVGRTYRVTTALQEVLHLRVKGIDTANTQVKLDEPLELALADGDTWESCHFYYTLQTADVATLDENHYAVATYAVGGLTYSIRRLFDVCLHTLENPITRELVARDHPDLARQEWSEQIGSDFQRQRVAAWDRVLKRTRRMGRRPALIADAADLEDWALAELLYGLQEGGIKVLRNVEAEYALEHLGKKLNSARDEALGSLSWYDESEDDAADDDEEQPAQPQDFIR